MPVEMAILGERREFFAFSSFLLYITMYCNVQSTVHTYIGEKDRNYTDLWLYFLHMYVCIYICSYVDFELVSLAFFLLCNVMLGVINLHLS